MEAKNMGFDHEKVEGCTSPTNGYFDDMLCMDCAFEHNEKDCKLALAANDAHKSTFLFFGD